MFDEEHRDEHDECRFEIDRLTARGRELELALQNYMDAMVYADKDTLMAAIAAAHKEALRLVPKRVYPSQETRPAHTAAHDCACAECVAKETRPSPSDSWTDQETRESGMGWPTPK